MLSKIFSWFRKPNPPPQMVTVVYSLDMEGRFLIPSYVILDIQDTEQVIAALEGTTLPLCLATFPLTSEFLKDCHLVYVTSLQVVLAHRFPYDVSYPAPKQMNWVDFKLMLEQYKGGKQT